jgi:predicted dehydrogenase
LIDVALIGCGGWGRHILRDLVDLGARVTVVARSDESRQRAVDGGASAVIEDIASVPTVAGVVVATPITTHAEVITAALGLGVPVYTEKPLTDDPAAARALAGAAPDRLFVMDKWRYHTGIEALASLARSGDLGDIVGLALTRVGWGNPHHDTDGVWVLAPHDLSICLEVLGELPTALSAVADTVQGIPTGIRAALGSGHGSGPWCTIDVSGRSPQRQRSATLYGSTGLALLSDAYAEELLVYPVTGEEITEVPEPVRHSLDPEFPLRRELRAFLQHLDGGPPPKSSAAEGAAIVVRLHELRVLAGLPS